MSILAASTGDVTLLPYEERLRLADDTSTPPATLAMLAKEDADLNVRWGVADNPSTPPETLVLLAGDEDEDVRWSVADNTNTPPETLAALARDEDSYVRRYAKEALRQRAK